MNADATVVAAESALAELLSKMKVDATIEVLSADPPKLNIETEDSGTLIGHRGDGLHALQHVLRLVLIRQGHETAPVIDVGGYRQRSEEQLQATARRKAEEVRTTGRLAVLSPMSSYERRLVHVVVKEFDDLVTESLGEAGNRRVMIKKA